MKRGWFGPKAFGWGAAPSSWQGWVVTLLMILGMVGVGLAFPSNSTSSWIGRGIVLFAYLAVVVLTYRRDARSRL